MKSSELGIRASTLSMLVFIQGLGFSSGLCTGDLCFDWKACGDKLILSCRIDKPNFKVEIIDPHGITQGDCHPNAKCESNFKNATLSLNHGTNTAKFEVRGKIGTSVNGNWTCKHGTGHQLAQCYVNVSNIEYECINDCSNNILAGKNETLFEQYDCQKNILLSLFGGYIIVVMVLMPICAYSKELFKTGNPLFFFKTNKSLGTKKITTIRITLLIIFSGLLFIFCWYATSLINGICKFSLIWALSAVGIVLGIVLSALCLIKVIQIGKDGNNTEAELLGGDEESSV